MSPDSHNSLLTHMPKATLACFQYILDPAGQWFLIALSLRTEFFTSASKALHGLAPPGRSSFIFVTFPFALHSHTGLSV